jgi:imidazoleglycerol phosphate dehydratase HisB
LDPFGETLQVKNPTDQIQGDHAHHIVESSFKAFARAFRNLLDGIDTTMTDIIITATGLPATLSVVI